MNDLIAQVVPLVDLLDFRLGQGIVVDPHVVKHAAIIGVYVVTPPAELKGLPIARANLRPGPVGGLVAVEVDRYGRTGIAVNDVYPVRPDVDPVIGPGVPAPVLT